MNKKEIISYLLGILIGWIFMYSLMAFINVDINASNWSLEHRAGLVGIYILACVFYFGAKNDKI